MKIAIKPAIRLDTGPARAVRAYPPRGFFMRFGLTCTGLAQPKPVRTIRTEPNKSRCANGFRLILP